MKSLGFLSFGHWEDSPGSLVRSAQDSLLQTIELTEAAEQLGINSAWIRVHHFTNSLSSPFPLLSAMAARTSRIELGTGVIAMRYENPLYMAELAATADLISAGRLQLGVSRGSPQTAIDGEQAFGYELEPGQTEAEDAAQRIERFREAIAGGGMATGMMSGGSYPLQVEPQSPGLKDRIWYGSGTRASAASVGRRGMHLMSSTLITEDTGEPFEVAQASHIEAFREAYASSSATVPSRVSVSRSILPIVDARDREYFGGVELRNRDEDQVGYMDGGAVRGVRTYVGEPGRIAERLALDPAVAAADDLLITLPNMLGVEHNTHLLAAIAEHIAPALGWKPAGEPTT